MDHKGTFVTARVLEREADLRKTVRRVELTGPAVSADRSPKRPSDQADRQAAEAAADRGS